MLRFMLKKALQPYEEKIGAAIEAHRWLYRCKLTPNQVISARCVLPARLLSKHVSR
jgi:hypothetical protein